MLCKRPQGVILDSSREFCEEGVVERSNLAAFVSDGCGVVLQNSL